MCSDVYIVANCCCCSAWPASQSWQAGLYLMLPPSLAAIISRASFLETIPVQHLRKKCAMIKLSNRTKRRTPNIEKIERSCLTGLQRTSGPRNRQSKASLTRTTPSSFITRCTLTKKYCLRARQSFLISISQASSKNKASSCSWALACARLRRLSFSLNFSLPYLYSNVRWTANSQGILQPPGLLERYCRH